MAHLLLNAVTTTGASNGLHLAEVTKDHTVDIDWLDPTNNITALVVALEGSNSNRGVSDAAAKWAQLASHTATAGEITAEELMFHVLSKDVKRVRLNITTLTGGAGAGDVVNGRYTEGRCC